MPAAPGKPADGSVPGFARSLGFGLMLAAWWVVTIEIPGRNLFMIAAQRGIERNLAPLTVWAFAVTQKAMVCRGWAIFGIIIAIILHAWLRHRRSRWDVYGRWLFRAGFVALYVILYIIFMLIFIGAELPLWLMPPIL